MAKLSTAAMSSPAADPNLKMKKSQRALPRCASIAAELESTMSEPSVENLTERERACLDHLKQAQDLGVCFAELLSQLRPPCDYAHDARRSWSRMSPTLTTSGSCVASRNVSRSASAYHCCMDGRLKRRSA